MLNLKQFNTAEVQFGRKFCVDTAPETPFHNLVWVDTDFIFMLVNSRWFTMHKRSSSDEVRLCREDLKNKVMCPESLSGPHLLAEIWSSPLCYCFSCWCRHIDGCIMQKADKYRPWGFLSSTFKGVFLFTCSQKANLPTARSLQVPVSIVSGHV